MSDERIAYLEAKIERMKVAYSELGVQTEALRRRASEVHLNREELAELIFEESGREADERSQILPWEACLSIADAVLRAAKPH